MNIEGEVWIYAQGISYSNVMFSNKDNSYWQKNI